MTKKGERLITISYVVGEDMECDVYGCDEEAAYMGGGRTCCAGHWTNLADEGAEERTQRLMDEGWVDDPGDDY